MKTVPLGGKKAAGRVVLVDDEDYGLVMQYRWRIWEPQRQPGKRPRGPYAQGTIHRLRGAAPRVIFMHKLITGYARTDHKDHDGLNNQRSNLRPATAAENRHNSRAQLETSSQYKGVHWDSHGRGWRATLKRQGRLISLGTFDVEKDAALARDAAARELQGEYAVLNFPQINQPPPERRQSPGRYSSPKAKRRTKPQPRGYDWMQAALRKQRGKGGVPAGHGPGNVCL